MTRLTAEQCEQMHVAILHAYLKADPYPALIEMAEPTIHAFMVHDRYGDRLTRDPNKPDELYYLNVRISVRSYLVGWRVIPTTPDRLPSDMASVEIYHTPSQAFANCVAKAIKSDDFDETAALSHAQARSNARQGWR